MGRTAFITGVTGQDGAYLAELLLDKGYSVHGLVRRSSFGNTGRIDELVARGLRLHYGDMVEGLGLARLLGEIAPDEIYNLAAQSHVHASFDIPDYTGQVDALGVLKLLEAVRVVGAQGHVRVYQASSSELYGNGLADGAALNEGSPFAPCSPYASAKLYAYWVMRNYRDAYGIFASNGILFNHESPLRGEEFVTRKVTLGVARLACGAAQDPLRLGNLDARRDWGHARDYVRAMWMILQAGRADDWVVATGQAASVRDFVRLAFGHIGVDIAFEGRGVDERGVVVSCAADSGFQVGQCVVTVDPALFRPCEVRALVGDASKIRGALGWRPEYDLPALVAEMVEADLRLVRGDHG